MQADAVILAAGSSARFGEGDKLLAKVGGIPVLGRAIAAHEAAVLVARVWLVTRSDRLAEMEAIGQRYAPTKFAGVVEGGERRRDSVQRGLEVAGTEHVSIHDGARPLVTAALIDACLEAAAGHAGAAPVVPFSDTVKEVEGGRITGHPSRERLRAVQTPQVVLREDWLVGATLSDEDETDDTAMVARMGRSVIAVAGLERNLKVTCREDLVLAEALLALEAEA